MAGEAVTAGEAATAGEAVIAGAAVMTGATVTTAEAGIAGEAVIAGATGAVPGVSGIVIGLCSEGEVTAGLVAGKLEGLEGSVGVEDLEIPHRPHVICRETKL